MTQNKTVMLEQIGNYRVIKEIGSGGMGEVLLAYEIDTGEHVAIKRIKSIRTDADVLEQFKQEVEVLRKLRHPNIIRLIDIIYEKKKPYIVMEYMPNGDIGQLLPPVSNYLLPMKLILEIAISICKAISYAHDLGVIHRDIKPSNILINQSDSVCLCDFGIAQTIEDIDLMSDEYIVGTLPFLSPEALTGESTKALDIWALGTLIYTMITGQNPFYSLVALVNKQAISAMSYRPDMPNKLDKLVQNMLDKTAQNRPTSHEIEKSLQEIYSSYRDDKTFVYRPAERS